MARTWEDELYDVLASYCEAGNPGAAKEYLALYSCSVDKAWPEGVSYIISSGVGRVARAIGEDYAICIRM